MSICTTRDGAPAAILIDTLKGKVKPAMAYANRPMLPHTLRMGTDDAPMGDLVARAKTIEGKGSFGGNGVWRFPLG